MPVSLPGPVRFQGVRISLYPSGKARLNVVDEHHRTIRPDEVTISDYRRTVPGVPPEEKTLGHSAAAGELTELLQSETPHHLDVRRLLRETFDDIADQAGEQSPQTLAPEIEALKEALKKTDGKSGPIVTEILERAARKADEASDAFEIFSRHEASIREAATDGKVRHTAVWIMSDHKKKFRATYVNGNLEWAGLIKDKNATNEPYPVIYFSPGNVPETAQMEDPWASMPKKLAGKVKNWFSEKPEIKSLSTYQASYWNRESLESAHLEIGEGLPEKKDPNSMSFGYNEDSFYNPFGSNDF